MFFQRKFSYFEQKPFLINSLEQQFSNFSAPVPFMLYIFAVHTLMFDSVKGSWIFLSASAFKMLQYVLLLKYMEKKNLTLPRYVVGKAWCILIDFSGTVYILLYNAKTWIVSIFLEVSYNVESENIVPCFSSIVTLKSIDLSCTLNLLSMHDSVTSYIGHLENTGSLSYAGLPNVDVFDYTI